jgi:hypothetical protein
LSEEEKEKERAREVLGYLIMNSKNSTDQTRKMKVISAE